ncbi:hypothetical protein MKD49_08260 [Herbaspirillum sp. WGmk3]|uniref:hypothetical protein n=1 Tax=Herbaspirillum sp. WGmk3 TaxID=2919925 RepID=UPI00209094EF|nr:hypothetical protein [Herbaspirillum sp. WGmk3]MCO4856471.1 hypothetical protein [Herbaspirillum sp. WGmk3]
MNPHFAAFIRLGKSLSSEKKLDWNFVVDGEGIAADKKGWDLTACVGDVPPPAFYLRDLGTDENTLKVLNTALATFGDRPIPMRALSPAWQDLIKAAVAEQLLVRRTSTSYVYQSIARPLRVLATCVDKEPWALTLDDFRFAVRIAKGVQQSGKLADLVVGLVKVLFDTYHLCDAGQMYGFLDIKRIKTTNSKSRQTLTEDELRSQLEERRRAERLPTRRAFWELVRIVMTERPTSFMDELRFAAIRIMIITGLRSGEATLLPLDCKRERYYVDRKGGDPGAIGGYSSALMLRHFAEKQQDEQSDSRILRESMQPVPEMFRDVLTETLERVASITSPLRVTLKLQCETNRLLPWFDEKALIPFTELYSYWSGNPFWLACDRGSIVSEYRQQFDPDILRRLQMVQAEQYAAARTKLDTAIYQFGNNLRKQMQANQTNLRFRTSSGNPVELSVPMSWGDTYLIVGEVEEHIRKMTPTKISDTLSMTADSGPVPPWELLFLHPKRSLAEERNDGICDVTRYFSVSRPDPSLVSIGLGEKTDTPSIFKRYGATAADQELRLESHMLRHLQNTELFRLGVADTIISKRYNRRSVTPSYEYDHRSLAEELEQISIPEEVELALGEKATTVAKMIEAKKASGPVVEAFLRIQANEGDMAAYEYLRVEADGFHATPYGHCLNSFTVDPCPKHLECFANCRHLSATDLPENRQNLIRLEGKFKSALEAIRARPSSSLGWKNQLEHAETRLAGIQKLLATPPGQAPFPLGADLSIPESRGVLDEH